MFLKILRAAGRRVCIFFLDIYNTVPKTVALKLAYKQKSLGSACLRYRFLLQSLTLQVCSESCIFTSTAGDTGAGVLLLEKHSVQDMRDLLFLARRGNFNSVKSITSK